MLGLEEAKIFVNQVLIDVEELRKRALAYTGSIIEREVFRITVATVPTAERTYILMGGRE
jgi:hypothetical protein